MSEELKERVDSKSDTEPVENGDNEDSDSNSESTSYSGSSSTDELQASSAAEKSDKCEELGGEFTKMDERLLTKSPSVVKQHQAIRRWERKASEQLGTKNSGLQGHEKEAATPPMCPVESQTTEGSGRSLHRTENEDDEKNASRRALTERDSSLINYKFNLGRNDDDLDEPDFTLGSMRRAFTEAAKPRKTIDTRRVKKTISNQNTYINQYMLLERIGRGSSGTVRKCKDITTGRTFAMKVLNKMNLRAQLRFERTEDNAIRRSSALDDVEAEIAIMKKLSHKNIVNLVEVLDSDKMVYLVLEYLPDGSIAHSSPVIKKIEDDDQKKFRHYVRDMVEGLAYLHSQRICHSDIKPENILIAKAGNDHILKLADFGLSKFLMQGQSRCVFDKKEGTPAFQAPECLNDSDDYKFSLFPTDVWALGVTIYQLKYGKLPFFSLNDEELTKKIKEDKIELPEDEDEHLKDLLLNMLAKDPAKRIGITELCSHPWITNDGTLSELKTNFTIAHVTASERSQAIGSVIDFKNRDTETSSEPQSRNRRHTTVTVCKNESKPSTEIPSNQKLDTNEGTNLANKKEGNKEDEKDEVSTEGKILKPSLLHRIKSAPMGRLFRRQGSKKKFPPSAKIQASAIPPINKDVNLSQNKQKIDKSYSKKKKRVTFSPPLPRKGSKLIWRSANSIGRNDEKEDAQRSNSLIGSCASPDSVSESTSQGFKVSRGKKNKKANRVTFNSTVQTFDPNSPPERTGKR